MIDVTPSPSPAPRVLVGSCDPVYRGIATIASDPAVPIDVAVGQSFVVALRVPAIGLNWSIATDTDLLVAGNRAAAYPHVDDAFELAKTLTIGDASYRNMHLAPGESPLIGGALTQFFLFNVIAEPFQQVKPGQSARLTFVQSDHAGATIATETFTVNMHANHAVC